MKILMVSNFVVFPWEGGNSRFTYILDNLNCDEHDVELVTSSFFHFAKKTRKQEELKKTPYKVTLIDEPGYEKNVSLKRFYSHYKLGKNLEKYLKSMKEKPDVIYCAIPSLDMAKVAAKYAKKNKIRFIIDVQDLWPEAFKMVFKMPLVSNVIFYPINKTANYIYKAADEIIAVSETYANRAVVVNNKYKNKLSVFLGTELENFDKIEKKKKEKEDEIVLTYIGTLGHSYNLSDTIKALKILQDKGYNNLKFKIMGAGPLKENFEELIKQLNVNAEMTGRLPYEKMVQELCACDIAINPIMKGAAQSIINKVGDYAAAGLPVVSTQECPEYRNLIDNKKIGLNCENDPVDIAEKIEKLINDSELRNKMGKNNRKLAEEKFDRKKTYKEIVELILKDA